MLAAEAVRLAAIEILCPTAAVEAETGFPTLAGYRVYDSREVALQDLDREKAYTPVLALHTVESGVALRGEASPAGDVAADAVMDVIAELAVVAGDEDGQFADAAPMAETDPSARLVLAALCAQVRMLLERSVSGGEWRRLVKRISRVDMQTFAVPEIGARWQRVTMRFHLAIRDDDFDMEGGGLPEPVRSLYEALPAGSYARGKLAELAAAFNGETLPPLEAVKITTSAIDSGPNDLSD
ncbi:MAG TPA: hypothetical protein VD840_16170 [Sinorhizobium sp.]|nr:hypothetical protein [Sinorhizobium sp.]